jgi:hypothetical protein
MSVGDVGLVDRPGGVGEERVVAPDREQGSWVLASSARRTTSQPVVSWRVPVNAVYSTSAT